MSEKTFEIVMKSLLVIGIGFIVIMFPGCFILLLILPSEISNIIFGIAFYGLLVSSGFVTVLFFVGDKIIRKTKYANMCKPKPVKADKIPSTYNTYDKLKTFLHNSLTEKTYNIQKQTKFDNDGEFIGYTKSSNLCLLDCFIIIRIPELTDQVIDTADNEIGDMLTEYYGSEKITDAVNVTLLFCVDRITTPFSELLNSNLTQEYKKGKLFAGISFGGKNIYIAKQKGGFAIANYKKLRKEFISIMNIGIQGMDV